MRITAKTLRAACPSQTKIFRRCFPRGANAGNLRDVIKAIEARLSVVWVVIYHAEGQRAEEFFTWYYRWSMSSAYERWRYGSGQPIHKRSVEPAPPRAKVKKLLAGLADLPAEAAAELRTVAEHKKEITRLKRELTTVQRARGTPEIDKGAVDAARAKGHTEGQREIERAYQAREKALQKQLAELNRRLSKIAELVGHSMFDPLDGGYLPEIPKLNPKPASIQKAYTHTPARPAPTRTPDPNARAERRRTPAACGTPNPHRPRAIRRWTQSRADRADRGILA